ncbi:MAG: hypothetical protein MUO88_14410, partial [Desulfobacterales bacterium]|nr:hypothetical protein [Desulfobacterales bacterium]
MEKEIKGKFLFDQKSKRFHRFQIVTNAGIVGSIYIPKNSEIPERLILEHEGEKDKMSGRQSGQIEAVVNALTELGGEVKSQTPLKDAIIEKLNCSEPTARRLIK